MIQLPAGSGFQRACNAIEFDIHFCPDPLRPYAGVAMPTISPDSEISAVVFLCGFHCSSHLHFFLQAAFGSAG